MAKLGTLIASQFKKLGIEITDELKALTLLDTDVPDEVSKKMDQGLISIEAAKTHPDVVKVLKQSTLAGADAKMDEMIKEIGLTVGEDFVNEKNTYEKIAMLSKMLHADGKKKGEGNSKEGLSEAVKKERDEYNKQKEEMQKQLKALTESLTAKETEFKTTRANDQKTFALHKKLFAKDYVFPKEMDNDIKVQTAMGVINTKLLSMGLVLNLNDAGQPVITDKDGNKAYNEKHEPIDNIDSFIDGVLTQNKLLNINDPNAQQQQQQGSGTIIPPGGQQKNAAVLNEIDAAIKAMA